MLTAEAFCFENSDCIERIEIKLKVLIVGKYSVFVSQLIEKYDKEGWEVYLLTGSNKKNRRYKNVFEQYDFQYNTDSVKNVIDSASPDLIIFTGAYDDNFSQRSTRYESSYYLSSLVNILMSANMLNVPSFAYISSHEVFGENYITHIKENTSPSPVTNRAILISQGEELVKKYGKTTGMDTVVIRLDHMYWIPKEKKDLHFEDSHVKLCYSAIRNGYVSASAKKIFSSVYVSDAVFSIFEICGKENRQHDTYQVTSEKEENEMELAKIIQNSDKGKFLIKDNTVGTTQRCVMSGKRLEEEFGITAKYSYEERIIAILDFMCKHKGRFLAPEEKAKGFLGKFWAKSRSTVLKLIPFFENIVVFIMVFMINNRTADSMYFQKLDIFLLYVVLFALFYGKRQAIFSAGLSVAGYIFRQQYDRLGIDILIDYNTYIWIAQLFIVGMCVGHLKDSLKMITDDKDEEIQYLKGKLDDIHDINSSNLRVKNILENHIIDYDESLGTLTNIVDRLGKLHKGDVLIHAEEVLCEVLGTEDIAIYKVSNGDYCRLLVSKTKLSRQFGKSLKYSEFGDILEVLNKKEIFINRSLSENLPIMASALYSGNNIKYIIFIWNLSFEKISLHEIDLLKVICYIIQNAIERDELYESATKNKRFLANTNILNKDEFEAFVQLCREAKKNEYMEFGLICTERQVLGENENLDEKFEEILELEYKILQNIRDTDIIGMGKDGHLYVILANSNSNESKIVVDRLKNHGVECFLKESL